MDKIYLAKSNKANPDDLMRARQILSRFSNIEVVEFKGGEYSHKNLLSCDVLLILPDLTNFDSTEDDSICIGKGLHEQIFAFQKNHFNECDILIIFEVKENIWVTQLDSVDIVQPDDFINYSSVILDQTKGVPLQSLLEHRFGELKDKDITVCGNRNYYYILIDK